jgi:putative heme-binding domain-containing protein
MTLPRMLLAVLLMPSLAFAQDPKSIPLWSNGAPGSEGKGSAEKSVDSGQGKSQHRRVSSIHKPSITVFLPPKDKATGAAVVICPGGGHRYLSIDHEGYDVARWLNSQGVAGIVLKYRLANEEGSSYKVDVHALADVQRAVRLVRGRANDWDIDPTRVGVMGFSAGGELAILSGTRFEPASQGASDPVDRQSSRPDFLALIYPGGRQRTADVSKDTPPSFLAVADDDKACADVCIAYYQALKKAGVSGELHLYARGGHGFGMADRPIPITGWTTRLREWLGDRGYLAARSAVPAASALKADATTDLAGTWKIKIAASDGEHEATIILTKKGDRFEGQYEAETGKNPAQDLSVKDGELTFRIEGKLNDQNITLKYKGRVQGDTINGEVGYELGGDSGAFPFEAKRIAAPKEQAPAKPSATPAARIKAPKGFRVDLVYSVPKATQGSWVNMTVDPKGRLIVSDQYGKLYRVSLKGVDANNNETSIEPIDAPIGEAHGLLWAFDSLYVVVNRGRRYDSGLYRVTDTNGDDKLDKVELLRKLDGGGEHGPHAVVLAPDGKSLYIVAGNATRVPETEGSLVPRTWGEDNLLTRMVDGAGFMTTEKAPGGYICRVSPDGKRWELVSMGFRNPFDIAFNRDGELFTYDSDMEWDVNMPWYRPTRVLHAVSGSDFGYRNGSGKWPPYYIDSLPPVVNVGPGSPTGIVFGYGTKFPTKYQEALFLCDWSYGKLYAVHTKPDGASYVGELEEFVAGTPLALTDVVVNPKDGAMYFTVGGRNTQSGLYRVTYEGAEATLPITNTEHSPAVLRDVQKKLEQFHGHADPKAVTAVWPYLGHSDRFLRWAARVAVEFQYPGTWRDKALAESSSPESTLNALLAFTHVSAQDPAHRESSAQPPDTTLRDKILEALDRLAWDKLSYAQQLDLVRVYQVVLNRFGRPDDATVSRLRERFDRHYPTRGHELNSELCQMLVYLQAPTAATKTMALLEKALTQEEQIDYTRDLRMLKSGWTPELRKAFFSWIAKSAQYKGGNSLRGFMNNIQRDALANLSDAEKAEVKPILDAKPTATAPASGPEPPFVRSWTVDELVPVVDSGLKGRDFDRGRTLFAATKCFACHRYNNEGGGLGPDLSGIAGRFNTRDLLESIVAPSKTISDQYEAVTIATTDGRVITGRIVNLNGDDLMINPDMLDPNKMIGVRRSQIEEMKTSPVSMMPEGLLNTLNKDEVLDLVAYLLSRGDRESAAFKKAE